MKILQDGTGGYIIYCSMFELAVIDNRLSVIEENGPDGVNDEEIKYWREEKRISRQVDSANNKPYRWRKRTNFLSWSSGSGKVPGKKNTKKS